MSTKKRLGELLLESGVIDEAMLQSALGHQRRWGGRLGQALLDLKLVSEPVIVEALARKSGAEVARLDELEPHALEQAIRLVPREFAQRNNVFPMAADSGSITVAMSDPTNLALTDELRFRTGRRIKVCIGGDREIAEAIRFHYPQDYQAPTAISFDVEPTGDGLPLAEPFEGGSTEAMRAMLEPTRHVQAATPVPVAPRAPLPAATPAPAPALRAPAPPVPSASPVPHRPAVPPPAPPVASVAPQLQARPVPVPAGPGTAPAPATRSSASIPATRSSVAIPMTHGSASMPTARPTSAAPVSRPLPTAPPQPAVVPAPAVSPSPAAPADPARDALLGAIPRGGFAPEEVYEELTPTAADEGEPISGELLVPAEELGLEREAIRELSPRDVAILDALDQLARGIEDPASPLKASRVAATLLKLMLKRKLISEADLLDELARR